MLTRHAPISILPPAFDLRKCSWFRPRTVSVLNNPDPGDRVQQELLPQLLDAFRAQGHTVLNHPEGTVNLMLAFQPTLGDGVPLPERIPERRLPFALTLMRDYGLSKRPENLVTFLTIPERLSTWSHLSVVEMMRTAAARIGTPKIVFLSGDVLTGRLNEATFCTLEGGHPTDTTDIVIRLRDRLVSAACARDVGNDYEVIENGLNPGSWQASHTPEALIEAGHRMAVLRLLPPPRRVGEYVSSELARIYERYLGMKGFSEGMLFAFDPETQTMMVTASGSWETDKRALRREEIVPIGQVKNGKLQVLAPPGIKPKGPSVEALEMFSLMGSVPRVRLGRDASGSWILDPRGEVEAPIIRAGIHVHVGVENLDEKWVEDVPPNRQEFPYGFGCGTDLMKALAQDSGRRSRAITDPSDSRLYARWQMLYHGDTVVELWKPKLPPQPLQGLLDLYDPERIGAIKYTPEHIEQL
jgi:hypothetical protein